MERVENDLVYICISVPSNSTSTPRTVQLLKIHVDWKNEPRNAIDKVNMGGILLCTSVHSMLESGIYLGSTWWNLILSFPQLQYSLRPSE